MYILFELFGWLDNNYNRSVDHLLIQLTTKHTSYEINQLTNYLTNNLHTVQPGIPDRIYFHSAAWDARFRLRDLNESEYQKHLLNRINDIREYVLQRQFLYPFMEIQGM